MISSNKIKSLRHLYAWGGTFSVIFMKLFDLYYVSLVVPKIFPTIVEQKTSKPKET